MKTATKFRAIFVVIVIIPIIVSVSHRAVGSTSDDHDSVDSQESIAQEIQLHNPDIDKNTGTAENDLVLWDNNSSSADVAGSKYELDITSLSLRRTSSLRNEADVASILKSLPLPDSRFILDRIEIKEASVIEGESASNKLSIFYGHAVDSWDEMDQQSKMWRTFYKTFILMFALVDDLDEISVVFYRTNGIPGPGGGIDVARISDESVWMLGITDWDAIWDGDCLSADAIRKSFEYIDSMETPSVKKVDNSSFPWCFPR